MELFTLAALGLLVILTAAARTEPAPPQVFYVVPQEERGGLLPTLLGLAIFVALVAYLLGNLPA